MRRRNSLSQGAIYQEMLKIAGESVPVRGPLRETRETEARTKVSISDRARMNAVCNMVDCYRKGWLTPANAVAVIKDIVR